MRLPTERAEMEAALEGLVRVNQVILDRAFRRGHPLPALYRSGVRYRMAPGEKDRWKTAAQLLGDGYGICHSLAAWRAAEIRREGRPARVIVRPSLSGKPGRFHAMVRHDRGIEDPSARCGMPIDVQRAMQVNARYL